MREYNVNKLSSIPLLIDTEHPDHTSEANANGALVGLDGAPVEGGVPTYVSDSSGAGRHVSMVPTGSGGFVPTYIAPDETFTVPEHRQALFAMTIVIDTGGILAVDGFLIEVN